MDLTSLLAACAEQGVELSVNDGNLDVSFDVMPDEALIAQLKSQKPALIEFISQMDSGGQQAIDVVDRAQPLALSAAQNRLWLIDQIEGGSAQYNMPSALQIDGPFNVSIAQSAFAAIIKRHETLRTVFVQQGKQVCQRVIDDVSFSLLYQDISSLDSQAQQQAIDGAIALEGSHVFNLSQDLLLRAKVLKCQAHRHILLLNIHHIASDGWSVGVLTQELNHFYQLLSANGAKSDDLAASLPPLSIQYVDFANWQLAQLQSAKAKQSFDYWQQQLAGLPQTHQLPLDYPRTAQQTFNGARSNQTLDAPLTDKLTQLAQSQGTTLFMLLQSAFAVLLNRYSGERDIVMGTPVAGRNQPVLEPLIGFFVNTLVLRSQIDGERSFIEQLQKNKQMLTAAFDHQIVQFEQLVEKLNPQRSMAHNPLFQVMFVMQNATEGQLQWPDLTVTELTPPKPTIRFDLELKVYPLDGKLQLHWLYNRDLFKPASIQRLLSNFAVLLTGIVSAPHQSLQTLPLLHQQERQLLLDWNQTAVDFNRDVTMVQLFVEQVSKTPKAIAIVDDHGQLTYWALYQQALAICQQLQGVKLAPEALVGVRMAKGRAQVAATLGIMMAGGAYLPMEHFWPDERCAGVVQAADCDWVFIDHASHMISDCRAEHLYPAEKAQPVTPQQWCLATENQIPTDRLAYVIFTSGSTGQPKGVAIEHRSAVNTLLDINQRYQVSSADRILAVSALSFDLSVYDIFGLLAVGGQVVFPQDQLANDPSHWLEMIEEHQITLWDTTPASAVLLVEQLEQRNRLSVTKIRHFMLSGDWIPPNLPKRLWQRFEGAQVHSQGGATEGSIWSVHYPITADTSHLKSIPYGRPLANQAFYILDKDDELCPIGVVGQLHIAGMGVAREYYQDANRTADSYFYHPTLKTRLYRTGDLGRLQVANDGKPDTIEFIGRVDNQLKVRGYRIEPGEIEASINQHQHVVTSLVLPVGDSSEQRQLAAYICPCDDYLEQQAKVLAQAQVQQWTDIFDDAYSETATEPLLETNLSGWNSSYSSDSSEAIAAEQMLEWIEGTVKRILACKTPAKTNRILEIGCGTGLLLYRYAEHFNQVCGLDISNTALNSIKRHCAAKGWSHVQLQQGDALSITDWLSASQQPQFDVIVINSVVQYFPNRRYLQQVIETASQLLCDEGKLFVGDVRDLDLVDGHNSAVVRAKLTEQQSVKHLAAQVQYAVQQEKELLISPSWFADLANQANAFAACDIMVKRGYHNNEMLRYRYDVILHRHRTSSTDPLNWLSWGETLTDESDVKKLLSQTDRSIIAIAGMPNQRVAKDLWLADGLKSWHGDVLIDPAQVNDEGIDTAGVALEQLFHWAESQGFDGVATWSQTDRATLDVIFSKGCRPTIMAAAAYNQKVHTNYPQLGRLAAPLTEALRHHLAQTLPNYMLPNYYVYLERLPLSANGKIDRKALPRPVSAQLDRGEYVAPRNHVEHRLCQLCQQILQLQQVGVDDNFFAIGGHSLLATRLLAAVKDALGISLPLRQIFATPTMAELATIINSSITDNALSSSPITKVPQAESYPLSFAQQRLWFIDQMEGASARYHIAGSFELEGKLNRQAFEQAVKTIVERHDVLRAVYLSQDGQPRQVIRSQVPTPFSYHTQLSDSELESAIYRVKRKPFDLSQEVPLRFAVFELTDDLDSNRYIVAYAMHHIASDGWSMSRLVEQLCSDYRYYHQPQNGQSKQASLAIQYQDYACWQRALFSGDELDRQLNFWTERLKDLPQLHKLPLDKPRPSVQSFAGGQYQMSLSTELSAHLQQLAKSQNATLFMLLHSAFSLLLSRYSGESDIVVGSAIAGRDQSVLEPLIGFFVNNLVLRSHCEPTLRFNQLLQQNSQFILDAYQHQHLPFELLVEKLQPSRNLSYSPLFQIMFVLQNIAESRFDMPGVTMTPTPHQTSEQDIIAKFDLELNVIEYPDKLVMQFSYNSDLFLPQTIERMAKNFQVLLKGIVDDPQASLHELPIISAMEKHRQLYDFNQTAVQLNQMLAIPQQFAQTAAQFAERTALVHGDKHISYQQLNQRANRLAHYLLSLNSINQQQPFIGLCLERGVDIVVALLAVLKAGAAYVPIDPQAPTERIEHMLLDANVALMLSQSWLSEQFELTDRQVINLDTLKWDDEANDSDPQPMITPDDLAYLIYTSGSTGLPKGVMIEHGALANSIASDINAFTLTPHSRFLHMVSFNFDAATSHLLMTLCAGGCLYLYDHQQDSLDLVHYAKHHNISHTALPVSVLAAQPRIALPSLTTLIVGAEHCPQSLADFWSQGRRFFNVYGPTETTITATYADYNQPQQRNTIGRAISNFSAYVLDSQQRLLPTGAVGELYIGGVGVGRGYLNQPELTERVFLADPFNPLNLPHARMYKTGDLVRYTPQGYLSFIGRVDFQVKVRGFRIELGEIEARLDAIATVATNVVVAKALTQQGDDKQLIAYLVLTEPTPIDTIRQQLATVLPEHMIPAHFVVLAKMPLNINGKIDRKALPEPEKDSQISNDYVAPRNPSEHTMVTIWQQLLGKERIGIKDNFFSLGGHSLLATRVLAQVRQQFDLNVPLKVLFEQPTVAGLCQAIAEQQSGDESLPQISAITDEKPQPLSFAQQRLWFIDQLEGSSSQYNIPAALRLTGRLDIAKLQSAFKRIIERHQVLRTCFIKAADGTPLQQRQSTWDFVLTVESVTDYRQAMVDDATFPFDLSQDLLLRAKLLKLDEQSHILLLNLHHIAADGWSMGLLIDELNQLYRANDQLELQLPELTVQYPDFAKWQRQHLSAAVLQQSLDYWQQQLADLPPVHHLPLDNPRPARQSYRGQIYRQVIDQTLTRQLNQLAQAQDSTLFVLLHSVFSTLLHRYSGDSDIVIGTPVAGRHDVALEPLIGFFTNTLVLRSDFSKDCCLLDIMQHSKATILAALDQQMLPFEMLVEQLNPERSLSHNPLFQVMLVLQNNQMSTPSLGDVEFCPITPDVTSTQFDLNLNINEIDGKLYVNWQYASDLFGQNTIGRMANHFAQLIQAFVSAPIQPLSSVVLKAEPQLRHWQQGPTLDLAHQNLVSLFEQQVDSTPNALALQPLSEAQPSLSYAELDARANYQAQQLLTCGVCCGDIVCLYVERSVDMFVAMLAILKAGAAYMPIDPILPDEMIRRRLTLAKPKAVLLGASLATKADELFVADIPTIVIDQQHSQSRLSLNLSADTSAYVLFTSGSTGEPKGIDMSHGALVNLIAALRHDCPLLKQTGKLLQFASIGFDMSFADAYLAFASGSALQLIDEAIKPDVAALVDLINQQRLTVLNLPYALLQALCEYCNDSNITLPSVKVMLSTAEQLKVTAQIRQYFIRHQKCHHTRPELINHYGPTETHVVTSLTMQGQPETWPSMPNIGKPIANTQCLILDPQGNPLPQGIYGELYLGGANVAKGYLNRPALSAERFVEVDLKRFYRSGDWARWCIDGTIEYQGRIDNQVKLRGFRVELGDIEACLLRHQQVEKAVVMVIEQQLCGFVESHWANQADLTLWCRSHLPDYMVPQHITVLHEFQLNTNGKIDRKVLAQLQSHNDTTTKELPASDSEIQLAAIWQQLLAPEREIYRDDNFFALGGHSLLITRLSAKVQSQWQIQLPVSVVFEQQQLASLADWIDEQLLLIQGVSVDSTISNHSGTEAASDDEWEF